MKTILSILSLLIVITDSSSQNKGNEWMIDQLSWIEGTWDQTNLKDGKTAFERWSRYSAVELRGLGVRLKGTDTLFVEKIRISIVDDKLNYVADVSENKKPVYFTLMELNKNGFVFENLLHDFPKRIFYQREGSTLKATVSGNGKSIDYYFTLRSSP